MTGGARAFMGSGGIPSAAAQSAARRSVPRASLHSASKIIVSGLCLLIAALIGSPSLAQQAAPPTTLADLQQRFTEHVNHPRFAASEFGVKIVSLDSGKTIFEHDAQKLLSPASNSKLYTIALALDRLGGDYRIKTSLYAEAKPNESGVLKGDLIVYGRGDPTINAHLNGGNIYKALAPLVAALTNAGVKRITGDIVGDESFIQGPPYGSGWTWDDMDNYYGAEISALTINDNTIQLIAKAGKSNGLPCQLSLSPATTYVVLSNRTETVAAGGRRSISCHRSIEQNVVYVTGQLPAGDRDFTDDVTMHNPAGLFVLLFKEALTRSGVKVSGKTRTINWQGREANPLEVSKLVELGSVESLSMRDIAREVQKPSQNLYTDLMLAHVGEMERREPSPRERDSGDGRTDAARSIPLTSEDLGIRALREFLAKVGIRRTDVQFEEGSGLSRNNLTTPNATIALLKHMSQHAEADAYVNALPIAGVDGTLRNRMKGTAAANNVRAKTGTLRWANSLSGHVKTAGGEHWIFSIMLNRYAASAEEKREAVDKIAVMLAEFNGKSAD
jgi:D-alanyl-D-alanine carboxypeptidase/D-alanyl-D-alanine-endopeptidase (penicillin-binding protein 4)